MPVERSANQDSEDDGDSQTIEEVIEEPDRKSENEVGSVPKPEIEVQKIEKNQDDED